MSQRTIAACRGVAFVGLPLGIVVAALFVGSADLAPSAVWHGLLGDADPTVTAIVRDLRVPRVLLAFLVGGSLAVTGAVLQVLVRNPLADPYLLGLSGGAGLGAVSAIALGLAGAWGVPLAALAGAVVAVLVVYRLAIVAGSLLDTRVLLLAGVVVGAFGIALMGAIMALSSAAEVRNALLWILGSFSGASWQSVTVFGVYASLPLAALFLLSRPMDLLALGEEPARFLGANVEWLKRVLYGTASALTAAAVAVSGIIGFVGIVVPHAVRLTSGHAHRTLLPLAFLVGGVLMVVADAVARGAFAPLELPVGVVTALIGVPAFLVLVRRWTS
ncbi:MAG TPA: iron ABC transporter permease [Gemmatimonadales bacterium]|nr:iron ABC transporter permease [Gemmatimonadales bacterium]